MNFKNAVCIIATCANQWLIICYFLCPNVAIVW